MNVLTDSHFWIGVAVGVCAVAIVIVLYCAYWVAELSGVGEEAGTEDETGDDPVPRQQALDLVAADLSSIEGHVVTHDRRRTDRRTGILSDDDMTFHVQPPAPWPRDDIH